MDQWVPHNSVPKDLSMPHGSSPRYSYAPEHEAAIVQHVAQRNSLAADVLRMQQAAGLRLEEAIHLRLDRIDFEQGTVEVKGKGGRIAYLSHDRSLCQGLLMCPTHIVQQANRVRQDVL
jgi:integrase